MARYTEASCRLCRREGMKLFLKGDRCYTDKCAMAKRAYAPGQHGQNNRKKVSNICNNLIQQLVTTREFFGYPVALKMSGTNFTITKDTTVKPYIWRGLINLEFLV